VSVDSGWWGKWRNEGIGVRHSTWGDSPEKVIAPADDVHRRIWVVRDGNIIEHECVAEIGFVQRVRR